jgi:ferrous iron transport protein B
VNADSVFERVALVGSPNSGKTSLFNWMTGLRFKTVNYPGSTVESHRGKTLPVYGVNFEVIDTPGIYSLVPSSRDEEVTLDILRREDLDRVILVLDALQLKRQLLLALQLRELDIPFSVALTMNDLAEKAKKSLHLPALSEILDAPVAVVDGRLGGGVKELVRKVHEQGRAFKKPSKELSSSEEKVRALTQQSRVLAQKVVRAEGEERKEGLDRLLVHSFLSFPIFVLVMAALFTSVFYVASPLMDLVDFLFASASGLVSEIFGHGLLSDFLGSGIIEGMGAVFVFVPQIFILFLGLSFLEESGYLARASTLIDRPLHFVGLSGRSFVPLLSGFACAVPGVMATRNLKSARERWIAVFILPLMTCSARLPVYALLLAFLFFGEPAWKPGLSLAVIYFASAFVGAVAAYILHKILKTKERSFFLMELPPYRWPQAKRMFSDSLRRTNAYIKRAGPTIFFFILILWTLTHLPYDSSWTATQQLENSVLAKIGMFMEPLFRPMGLDWRVGLALLSAFVAREVFVSAMAVIFNLANVAEGSLQASLITQMKDAHFPDGHLIFTTPAVVAMIVFFMLALQCLSTTGVVVKEMGSWKYGLFQLVVLNVVAYAAAVLVFQLF